MGTIERSGPKIQLEQTASMLANFRDPISNQRMFEVGTSQAETYLLADNPEKKFTSNYLADEVSIEKNEATTEIFDARMSLKQRVLKFAFTKAPGLTRTLLKTS